MAVVQQVRLDIFSRDELKDIENDVLKAESLAQRKQVAVNRINQQQTKGGIFGADELNEALPRTITKRQDKSLIDRVEDSKLANSIKSNDTTSAAAFVRSNAFKTVQSEVNLLKEGQKKTTDALSFVTDFQGTAGTKLLGAAGKFLPTGFVLSVATTVFALIESQFGSGGIFDRRKKELNSTKSLIGLERETDIIGGDTLFLGNPTLVQGVARNQTSNTENLRDGQRRFVLRSNGY